MSRWKRPPRGQSICGCTPFTRFTSSVTTTRTWSSWARPSGLPSRSATADGWRRRHRNPRLRIGSPASTSRRARATKRFGWGGAPGLFSRAFLAWYLIELGEFEQARQVLDEGFEMLSTVDQPFSRVLLQWSRGLYQFRRGEFDSAASILAETLELSRTAEVLTMHAMVAALLGQALIATGRAADAFEVLSDAVGRETYRFGGKYVWTHLYLAYADARYQQGETGAGHGELRHALNLAESCGEIVHYAYGLKLLGDFRATEAEPG